MRLPPIGYLPAQWLRRYLGREADLRRKLEESQGLKLARAGPKELRFARNCWVPGFALAVRVPM